MAERPSYRCFAWDISRTSCVQRLEFDGVETTGEQQSYFPRFHSLSSFVTGSIVEISVDHAMVPRDVSRGGRDGRETTKGTEKR